MDKRSLIWHTHVEPHGSGAKPFVYGWSGNGNSGTRTIWAMTGAEFKRLLIHWNAIGARGPINWSYWPITQEVAA